MMKKILFGLIAIACFASSSFAQDSLNVRQVGFCEVPARGHSLDVQGNYVYIAAIWAGVRIIDATDRSNPVEVSYNDLPDMADAVVVKTIGSFTYVEDYYRGLRILDISNPFNPTVIGTFDHSGDGRGMTVVGNHAYLASDTPGLRIVDISSPSNPTQISSLATPGRSHSVVVSGSYAYVSQFNHIWGADGYSIIDVSNPNNPSQLVFHSGSLTCQQVDGNIGYFSAGENGMRILDLSDPYSPIEVGFFDTIGEAGRIIVIDNFAFIADGTSGFRIVDITDLSAPFEVGFYDTPLSAVNVSMADSFAYVLDNVGSNGYLRILDCREAMNPTIPCPPTSLPFIDNFDNPELDSCWTWIREDTSHWSLTERPGWMRIVAQDGNMFGTSNYGNNKLLRSAPSGNFICELKSQFHPEQNYQGAMILLFADEDNYIWLNHEVTACGGTGYQGEQMTAVVEGNGVSSWDCQPVNAEIVWARLEKQGNNVTLSYSIDSLMWQSFSPITIPWSNRTDFVGFTSWTGQPGIPEIPADFDYFHIDPLPGTNVCGDVSGVWDSTGSPYYVNCDVTVPAGQTLEIHPGVQVLFTGHYKFNVFGNLQAIGTEQDSIVFTRAFPTEESKWAGIRIVSAGDTCRLDHCVIEFGSATGSQPDGDGGGVYCGYSYIVLRNCKLGDNSSQWNGGAACFSHSDALLQNCLFESNQSNWGGGSVMLWDHSNVGFSRCNFILGTSVDGGGAIQANLISRGTLAQCVISSCSSSSLGDALACYSGSHFAIDRCTIVVDSAGQPFSLEPSSAYEIENTIVWGHNALVQDPQLSMTFSDIQGSYPGTGNIDEDPLFADPENGDFHLTEDSPCIDAGDPNSPLDPDSTITDMGAFYYPQPNLLIAPTSLNFGLLDVGADSTIMISFSNPTVLPAVIDSFRNSLPIFAIDTTGLNGQFNPQFTTDIPVTFSPSASGTYQDTIVIIAEISGNDTIRIPLRGEAAVIPMPVDSLVIKKGPMNGIELRWAPVTQTISGQPLNDVGYVIYGAVESNGAFIPFGFTTSTTYQHPFILNTQEIYFYYVEPYVEGERVESDIRDLIQGISQNRTNGK